MRAVAIILGLAAAAVAVMYFVMPAGSLPGFFPGFEAGSDHVHMKHGLAAAAAGVVLFAIGWFAGRAGA
jgi:hypothetical protein